MILLISYHSLVYCSNFGYLCDFVEGTIFYTLWLNVIRFCNDSKLQWCMLLILVNENLLRSYFNGVLPEFYSYKPVFFYEDFLYFRGLGKHVMSKWKFWSKFSTIVPRTVLINWAGTHNWGNRLHVMNKQFSNRFCSTVCLLLQFTSM